MFSATNKNSLLNRDVWCLDSGGSSHLCSNCKLFEFFETDAESITLAGQNKIWQRAGVRGKESSCKGCCKI